MPKNPERPKFEEQFEKPPEIKPEKEEAEEKFEREFKLSPEDKELIPEIIEHPIVQRGLDRYEIFSKYYFEGLEESEKKELKKEGIRPPSPEKIKERADWVLKEDPIYQGILENKDFIKSEDFISYIGGELKRERLDKLKRVKEEGNLDETLREIFINQQIEKEIKEREEKGIITERIGNMWVEVIDDEAWPHLPRIAEDWPKTLRGMKEGHQRLAELLQTDKRFETVKEITGMSWLFGNERIKQEFDRTFGWHPYSEKEIEKFSKENPESYKDIQKIGIEVSPKLFKNYLLKEELPKIGGRWIAKEEFIEKMTPEIESKDIEEIERAQKEAEEAFEEPEEEK